MVSRLRPVVDEFETRYAIRKCPLGKHLRAGTRHVFQIDSPAITDVAIYTAGQYRALARHGSTFEGEVEDDEGYGAGLREMGRAEKPTPTGRSSSIRPSNLLGGLAVPSADWQTGLSESTQAFICTRSPSPMGPPHPQLHLPHPAWALYADEYGQDVSHRRAGTDA